jgi:hypothetical protein
MASGKLNSLSVERAHRFGGPVLLSDGDGLYFRKQTREGGISSTGCVTAIAIVGSPGSEFMDSAVRNFLEATIFLPGDVGGKAVESVASIPVVFRLTAENSRPSSPRSESK